MDNRGAQYPLFIAFLQNNLYDNIELAFRPPVIPQNGRKILSGETSHQRNRGQLSQIMLNSGRPHTNQVQI